MNIFLYRRMIVEYFYVFPVNMLEEGNNNYLLRLKSTRQKIFLFESKRNNHNSEISLDHLVDKKLLSDQYYSDTKSKAFLKKLCSLHSAWQHGVTYLFMTKVR